MPEKFRKVFGTLIKIGLFDESIRFCNVWLRNGKMIKNSVVDILGEYVWISAEFFWVTEYDIRDIKVSWNRI